MNLEASAGLLVLALEWLGAHLGTLAAVAFGLVVLYELSDIRRIALQGASSIMIELGTLRDEDLSRLRDEIQELRDEELSKLRDEIDELKDAVHDLNLKLAD